MIQRKALAYEREINKMESLPIYDGVIESIETLRNAGCKLGIVSGALRSEITFVLERSGLTDAFYFIVAADDVIASKPEPEGYLLGIKLMQELFPELDLKLENFLAIEDSFPGIQAAKAAGIGVVGVAHRYPFHMMQRTANWAVDSLSDLEWSRLIPSLAEIIEPEDDSNKPAEEMAE
jgi:phosphoglycolate phosphatase/beta-phosphoglucomutase